MVSTLYIFGPPPLVYVMVVLHATRFAILQSRTDYCRFYSLCLRTSPSHSLMHSRLCTFLHTFA